MPMIQFQYMAPWVPTFNSSVQAELVASNNTPPFVSFQFATCDDQGYPHNRTLVFRGFLFDDKSNNILTFTTDKRMSKYQELINNDKFEAVFYFAKLKKQFRFRGRARIIDEEYKPLIDLSSIQPKTILQKHISRNSDDSDEDSDAESEDGQLSLHVKAHHNKQLNPVSYPVLSPTLNQKLQREKSTTNLSYTNLHDLSAIDYYPPQQNEWEQEITRQWANLLKNLKSTFRKPLPLTPLTADNQKLIDKIARGVDGKKEEAGLTNFAVVALFVDYVDLVELEKDRRYIYKKDGYHTWSEEEVCP